MDRTGRMTPGAPVAALPMYDFPEIASANDALWRRIAAGFAVRGVEAPAALTRGIEPSTLWRDSGLIFAQACGYPYMTGLDDAVRLIATPEYTFPGCDGADHESFIVCSARDSRRDLAAFRGAVAAVNFWDSDTGMNLFRAAIAPFAGGRPFFAEAIVTGSHAASLEAVAGGRAALAAIDCVTFGLLARIRPWLVARVAVFAKTPPSPGLPFVLSAKLPEATLAAVRAALFEALADPALAEARAAIGLKGARVLTTQDYERVLDLEREAEAAGYPRLA
jgi:ABC-type phosphate/phosphonate transport system substrate-binding protein